MFVTSIVIATVLNFLFREWLYKMSIDYVLELQKQGRDPYMYQFYTTMTLIGSTEFIYGTLLLIYIFCSRALALHYTFVISSMMFWLCFMKTIVMYPRPFQYHPDIMPTSCSGQWGCPSATSIRVTTLVTSLFLDFVYSKRHRFNLFFYVVGCSVTLFCVISVLCSRVYLAAHSINQVLFGAAIGIEASIFLHFCVKP